MLNGKVTLSDSEIERYRVEKGDLFFTRTSEIIEEIGMNSIMLDDSANTVFSGFVLRGRTIASDPLNNLFKKYVFSTKSFRNEMIKKSSMTTRALTSGTALKEMYFKYPKSQEEQNRIGQFLTSLDETIALHQRKLDNLKQMKKGFLQVMFPEIDEKTPQVRFANFDSEWEQRKLDELAENVYGGGTPKTSIAKYWDGNIPWLQSSDLKIDVLDNINPTKCITQEAIEKSATKLIPKNSLAIVTRVGVGKLVLVPYSYSTSQDFLSLSYLKINDLFALYSIYKLLQRESKNVQGTSIKGITKSDLLTKLLNIPLHNSEQEKIGTFFKQLDNTIAFNQSKLNQLNTLKKAYLQNMFV